MSARAISVDAVTSDFQYDFVVGSKSFTISGCMRGQLWRLVLKKNAWSIYMVRVKLKV